MANRIDLNAEDDLEPTIPSRKKERLESSDTVMVACKLPNGLEIYDEVQVDAQEQMFGGGTKTVKVWRRSGETYILNGNAVDIAKLGTTGEVPHLIIGGFGITSGIPRDFWERWLERHKRDELVTKGYVKAMGSEIDIRRYARENAKLRSGLEPLDPENPRKVIPGLRQDDGTFDKAAV